jgi:abhydrolase domain-containing protein 8
MHVTSAAIEEVRPGRSIFVRKTIIGCPEQDPAFQLLFVHGICGSEMQYKLLMECMDQKLTDVHVSVICLLFDSVGCGQSPSLPDWDAFHFREVMSDLDVLIRTHLDQAIPTVVVGHSYAPSIFLPLFRRHIEDEQALVINLVGCIFLGTSLRFPENPQKDGGHPVFVLPIPILNCIQGSLTKTFIEIAIHPEHKELRSLVEDASNRNDMFVAKAYYRHAVWATPDDLVAVQNLPSVVIHGSDDGIIPVTCAKQLKTLLPKSELVIVRMASHLVMMEQPDKVSEVCLSFLQRVRANQCS